MKFLARLAATLLSLLVLVLVAGALVLTSRSFEVDATAHKDWIARAVRDRTGLEIQVNRELHLRFGPILGVRAQGLAIRNPDLNDDGLLLSADGASLEVETAQLLSGELKPTALELDKAEVFVRRNENGRSNWDTGSQEVAPAERMDVAGDAFLFPDAMRVRVRDSRLEYADDGTGTAWEVRLGTADLTPEGGTLRVDLDGALNGSPVRLKGTTTTLSGLVAAEEPVPLDLAGNLLGLDVEAKGSVANPWSGAAVSAHLRLAGSSLGGLEPWLGKKLASMGPVKARLDVHGSGVTYRLDPFDLAVGKGRFDGSLRIDLSGRRPRLDLDVAIEEVDIRPIFATRAAQGGRGGRSAQVFSVEPFPVDWMDAADLQARVQLRNVITPFASRRTAKLDVRLRDRRLEADFAGRAVGNRNVTVRFELDGTADPVRASLHVKGDKLRLEPLLATTDAEGMIRGDLDVSLDLKGAGASPDALMGSIEGDLLLLVEQAEADVGGLDRMAGGTNALVGQLVTPRQKLARVNCGVAAFRFQAGRTEVRAILDTPYSTVVSTGTLDLGAETLDVRVIPDSKGVTLSVATPVTVKGPLADPTVRVEEGGLLLTLTDLASRIAVPHLLLVDAFGDAVAENPCVRIASGRIEETEAAKPLDAVTRPVGGIAEGAGAVVRGTGSALKDAGSAVVKGAGGLVDGLLGRGRQDARTPVENSAGDEGESLFEAE